MKMMSMAAMKISPPMVGVPLLLRCFCGPSARMDCPTLSRISSGSRKWPITTVSEVPAAKHSNNSMPVDMGLSPIGYYLLSLARNTRRAASRSSKWSLSPRIS